MMMVGYDGEFAGPVATGALREQEAAVMQLPTVSGTVQGVYLFFASKERKMYSSSLLRQRTNIPPALFPKPLEAALPRLPVHARLPLPPALQIPHHIQPSS